MLSTSSFEDYNVQNLQIIWNYLTFSVCLRCRSGLPTVKSYSYRVWLRLARTTSTPSTSKHNTSTSRPTAWSVCVYVCVVWSDEFFHQPLNDISTFISVQNGSVNVDSVVTVAARLAEAGHYGAERIAMVSSRLQEDWKSLTTALEERSNTLAMATGFHQGAEQVCLPVFYLSRCLSVGLYVPAHICLLMGVPSCLSDHRPIKVYMCSCISVFVHYLSVLHPVSQSVYLC